MDQLDLHLGQTVAIIGMGAIGQMMLQLCHKASAGSIIVIEPVEEKRQLAMELGATLFINPNKEDVTATIRNAGIVCVDRVLECVGLPQTAAMALEVADHGATVVLFGVADRDAVLPLKLYEAFLKELTVKTSYINPHTTQRAIDLLAASAIKTQGLIQDLSMDQLPPDMETRALSRLGKVIVSIPQD
jgi:threonine dehydrogenase-like Zn-dependent dehydrogenase